ncbi:hypothetical protein M0811_14523 [Anaeramoeba ignava]|uniref:Uncharacterized protein n=1 Tax=Anaeramoeba ignava TaxID=1746090 RepID=A0A9Q0LXN2_ANAIG|nr:hypothetical protein M0811_14523 [Anaeramoeba ignava]
MKLKILKSKYLLFKNQILISKKNQELYSSLIKQQSSFQQNIRNIQTKYENVVEDSLRKDRKILELESKLETIQVKLFSTNRESSLLNENENLKK